METILKFTNEEIKILRQNKTMVIIKRFLNQDCSNHCLGERKSNSAKGVQDKSTWDIVSQFDRILT